VRTRPFKQGKAVPAAPSE